MQLLLGTGVDCLSWSDCLFSVVVQNEGDVMDATMKSQTSCYGLTLLVKRVLAFILTPLVSLTLDLDQFRREKHCKNVALGLGCLVHTSAMWRS